MTAVTYQCWLSENPKTNRCCWTSWTTYIHGINTCSINNQALKENLLKELINLIIKLRRGWLSFRILIWWLWEDSIIHGQGVAKWLLASSICNLSLLSSLYLIKISASFFRFTISSSALASTLCLSMILSFASSTFRCSSLKASASLSISAFVLMQNSRSFHSCSKNCC